MIPTTKMALTTMLAGSNGASPMKWPWRTNAIAPNSSAARKKITPPSSGVSAGRRWSRK